MTNCVNRMCLSKLNIPQISSEYIYTNSNYNKEADTDTREMRVYLFLSFYFLPMKGQGKTLTKLISEHEQLAR